MTDPNHPDVQVTSHPDAVAEGGCMVAGCTTPRVQRVYVVRLDRVEWRGCYRHFRAMLLALDAACLRELERHLDEYVLEERDRQCSGGEG